MNYTGTLAPGESVVIDMDAMTAVKGSTNVLKYLTGDFISLVPGGNLITYTDAETGRTVELKSTHYPRDL